MLPFGARYGKGYVRAMTEKGARGCLAVAWSFYGKTRPVWLLLLAWALLFALPFVGFFSLRVELGYEVLFCYSIISGLVILVCSIFLRSWLLLIGAIFHLFSYWYFAFLFFGVVP